MNLNHAEVPFEVWCDSLEDTGIETEDLRLLFSVSQTGKQMFKDTIGTGPLFGNGIMVIAETGNGWGYGHGHGNGSGAIYGYEEINNYSVAGSGYGCGYGCERES